MLVVRGQRRRSQVGWLRVGVRMRMVVVVEVASSVGVGAALVQRVSGGRLGRVGVMGEVVVRGVGGLKQGETRPSPWFDPTSPSSSCPPSSVEAGGVHGDKLAGAVEREA